MKKTNYFYINKLLVVQPLLCTESLQIFNSLLYLLLLLKILLSKSANIKLLLNPAVYTITFKNYQMLNTLHPLAQPLELKLIEKTYQTNQINPKVRLQKSNRDFNLYFLYLRFSFKNIVFFFKPHSHFRLFFNFTTRDNIVSLSTSRFFNRWTDTQLFISNLFFYNFKILSFGNKFLWNEILALNWLSYRSTPRTHFLPTRPFFFKDFILTSQNERIFSNLLSHGLEILFIVDAAKHINTVFFFKTLNSFVIGLVPINFNPWEFSYPIPIFSQNLLLQFYFLKLLFNIYYFNQKEKFSLLKQLWTQNLL